MQKIEFIKREKLLAKPGKDTQLGFGEIFTDYMAQVDYSPEKGWHNAQIKPYAPFMMDPANASFHYGQLIFEGLKAFTTASGEILLFRPEDNFIRMGKSAQRLCMPAPDMQLSVQLLKKLIEIEKEWVPKADGCSLYIRPFMMAKDDFLGVAPSKNYSLYIILSPVGSYYKGGLAPVNIFVEDELVRAVPGGTGESKCAGNYAASLSALVKAKENGCEQVLWLDGINRKYIEEIGTSNAFFVIDGKVVTPELNGSILAGITRNSALQLLRSWGMAVEERRITIEELIAAHKDGALSESFATGTAAVISPVGSFKYKDIILDLPKDPGAVALKLYESITAIQKGQVADTFGWTVQV